MVVTTLSEESMSDHFVHIQLVEYWIGVLEDECKERSWCKEGWTCLAQTRRKHDYLVQLSHLLQEIVYTRPLDHVYIMPLPLNLYGNNVVRLGYQLRLE